MRKFETLLAILLILVGVANIRCSAQDSIKGEWQAKFESPAEGRAFYLQLRTAGWNHEHTWGSTHEAGEFSGLDLGLATAEDSPAHFELRRDAGTFTFDGRFHRGEGFGEFRFTPNPEYVQEMKALGYSSLSLDQLFAFAVHDVTRPFVKAMGELGYRNLSADQLIALRIHGATPEFARAMKGLLPSTPSVDQLVAMRIHGVSLDFANEMKTLLGKDFSVDQYVAFRIHGVSPEFVKEMKGMGYDHISPDQLVAMRIHGVNAAFVKEVREHGYKNPTIDELIEMRIHGVTRRTSM